MSMVTGAHWLRGDQGFVVHLSETVTYCTSLSLCCDVGIFAWSSGTINILGEPGAGYSRNLTIHPKDSVIGRT